jgi:hypothetical protein
MPKNKFSNDGFSKVPKIPDLPKKVFDLKSGDLVSFKISAPELPPIFNDVCEIHIEDNVDLSIIKKKGRKAGTGVFYKLDNIYNYQSQSQRYDRAINLGVLPASIKSESGKTCYLFCSPSAIGGFYEVCVDEKDLFISFTVNPLIIVCPRPFNLSDLSELDTNAEWVKFTQLQGRETLIFPNDGSAETLNPIISIIGNRTPKDPPILILAEAEGSSTIIDILAIDTTITDRINAVSGIDYSRINPAYSIPCQFRLIPSSANTAQCGASIVSATATWFLPPQNRADILGFMPQVNNGGVWQNMLSDISPLSLILVEAGKSYRVLTFFAIFNNVIIADSCVLRFEQVPTMATDAFNALSGCDGLMESRQYLVTSEIIEIEDELANLSGCDGLLVSQQYLVQALVLDISDSTSNFSGCDGLMISQQYALGGIIAG